MPTAAISTLRRSRRFQPIPNKPLQSKSSVFNVRWPDEDPVYIRPLNTELDYDADDLEHHADQEDEDEDEEDEREAVFYDRFIAVKRNRVGKTMVKVEEEYSVGDTILIDVYSFRVKKLPSIGVITGIWEVRQNCEEKKKKKKNESQSHHEETALYDRMRIRVRWFHRPTELPKNGRERSIGKNELFFSLNSSSIISPSSIEGHCVVGDDEDCEFYCRCAANAQKGLYYQFDWESKRQEATKEPTTGNNSAHWDVDPDNTVSPSKRRTRRKKCDSSEEGELPVFGSSDEGEDTGSHDDSDVDTGSDEDTEPPSSDVPEDTESLLSDDDDDDKLFSSDHTPRKRKRGKGVSTPSPHKPSRSTTTSTPHRRKQPRRPVPPTPHSLAALRKRSSGTQKRRVRTRRPDIDDDDDDSKDDDDDTAIGNLPADAWLRALHMLHIGNRPKEGGTLPCREDEFNKILSSLQEILEEGIGGCVYVSGVPGTGKTATVHAVVRELKRMAKKNETNPFTYVEINGLKLSDPCSSYSLLWESLIGEQDESEDETRKKKKSTNNKESLRSLTKYFSRQRHGPISHACIVLMDELDQLMTSDQDVVYNFFNWPMLTCSRLIVLAVANTMDLPERVMSGRVRSRLGMTRINFQPYTTRQLEEIVRRRLDGALKGSFDDAGGKTVITEDAIKLAAMRTASVSGDARRVLDICRRAIELVHPVQRPARPEDIREILGQIHSSPISTYIKECTFHEQTMLASILKCMKRTGVEEVHWTQVQDQHQTYANALHEASSVSHRKLTNAELRLVLDSLVSSRAVLVDRGRERKMVLNVDMVDVERVLGDEDSRWKTLLG